MCIKGRIIFSAEWIHGLNHLWIFIQILYLGIAVKFRTLAYNDYNLFIPIFYLQLTFARNNEKKRKEKNIFQELYLAKCYLFNIDIC